MKSSNPLFVDSTKFAGDGVRTQFELTKVLLYEGEKAFAKVINNDGHPQIVPLHEAHPGVFSGSIYLRHLEEIRYLFFIKFEDRILLSSREYSRRAAYLISESWEPLPKLHLRPASEPSPVKVAAKAKMLVDPLPEFDAQRKVLASAVEALENFFPETQP